MMKSQKVKKSKSQNIKTLECVNAGTCESLRERVRSQETGVRSQETGKQRESQSGFACSYAVTRKSKSQKVKKSKRQKVKAAERQNLRKARGSQCGMGRRGMLLVVVLAVVAVLGLVAASFAYWMHADYEVVSGLRNRQQARLAAESGLARVMLLLREHRIDMDEWYNNRDAFRRILVWAPDKIGGSESLADQEKVEGQPAWRFQRGGDGVRRGKTPDALRPDG